MEEKVKSKNRIGLLAAGLTGATAVGLVAVSVPFILPALRKICLPYIPATDRQVQNVLFILKQRKGNVIDLGSGDGRIVLAAAKIGHPSFGVELNPWLILYSTVKASYLRLNKMAKFTRQNIWKTDLRKYDNVVIFGVEQMMSQLEEKLSKELGDDSCVIACRFPLPNWKPSSSVDAGIDTVWLYKKQKEPKL